jgi:DNA integrity scanning protein DisA with diadenylate cyclase activity
MLVISIDVEAILSWIMKNLSIVMIISVPLYYIIRKIRKKQLREMLRKILSKHWWIVQFRCNILEHPLLIFSVVFIVIWWLLKKIIQKEKA